MMRAIAVRDTSDTLKIKTVCRWLTRFSRLQTVVLYFNREHKHIGVLFICGIGAGF